MATREEDVVTSLFTSMTHNYLLFFTDRGRVYRLKGYQVPEAGRNAKGTNMVNLLSLDADEKVTAVMPITGYEEGKYFVFVTRQGVIKRLSVTDLDTARKTGIRALTLRDDDALICVCVTEGNSDIMVASSSGRCVRFNESEVRVMGRDAAGVRAIDLAEGDVVVGAVSVTGGELVLTVSENGYGKRTPLEEFSCNHRGGKGVKCHEVTEKTGAVAAIAVPTDEDDLMMITSEGTIIRTDTASVRVCGRASQGVILMRASDDAKVIDLAITAKEEETEAFDESEDAESAETAPVEE